MAVEGEIELCLCRICSVNSLVHRLMGAQELFLSPPHLLTEGGTLEDVCTIQNKSDRSARLGFSSSDREIVKIYDGQV